MDIEQQKLYQLENLGIVRKDEISQGQCHDSHLDLAASVPRCPPWATSSEVAEWNAFETTDPNPDRNCDGLDRIAGGNLHRARMFPDVKIQILSQGAERKLKQGPNQKTIVMGSGGKSARKKKKQTSAQFAITGVSSHCNAHEITAVPRKFGRNNPYSRRSIKGTSHRQAIGLQFPLKLSNPHDFMAAVNEASSNVPEEPITTDSSNTGDSCSAIQDLIDLDFGGAVQSTSSDFTSSTWPQEANQFYSAMEVPSSSASTDVTNVDQSFSSSISSIREQHKSINLKHAYSNCKYDAEFLKKFSDIRTMYRPFHPDAAPIIRNQEQLYLPLIPVVSLSNLSLNDTNSGLDHLGQEYITGLQASALMDRRSRNEWDEGRYFPNQITEKSIIKGNLMDSKYAH